MTSGEWLSTMCLTEAHAGSDLGLLRTKAEPRADGSYAVTGQKTFISGGEHDLTDNIVHMVLARLRDAPAGTKGLSLLLVPKVLPDGARNAVHCDAIEKKMHELASQDLVYEHQMWPKQEAIDFFRTRGEPLKVQLIEEKTAGQSDVSVYTIKDGKYVATGAPTPQQQRCD